VSRLSDWFESDKQGRRWNKKFQRNWNDQEPDDNEPEKEKPIGKFLWWMYGDLSSKWTVWYVTLEIVWVVCMGIDLVNKNWLSLFLDALFLRISIANRVGSQKDDGDGKHKG
jgi:hypothetical protein